MIGVIPKPDQLELVEEFFELFKTPWELYRPGDVYQVVIATADQVPEVDASLLLIYGPAPKEIDARLGLTCGGRLHRAVLIERDSLLPIYNGLLTFLDGDKAGSCVTTKSEIAGLRVDGADSAVLRLGYDLFEEVKFLLSAGQPLEHAPTPTLEIHIRMLREWILGAGIPVIEIPPAPAGHSFVVCLTHDIDFVGMRNHFFDHSMWGFVYRATAGAIGRFFRARLSLKNLLRNWLAVASLPFVYAGWARDFWEPFEWYLEAEEGLPSTYFLIPFKRRPGENVPGRSTSRRAAAYDVGDLSYWTSVLPAHGCELGVHGIDAWHSAEKGRKELAAITTVTGKPTAGVRIHWLLRDKDTPSVMEQAGYEYDSTFGYNETVGYRAGTSQVFRPSGATTLLELPLHIQDGALFYPQRLDLSEPDAEKRCQALIDNARRFGGVLTLLWHDRSHGPERLWGEFYRRLLQGIRSSDAWFGTGTQIVSWFRKRRQVRFERAKVASGFDVQLHYEGEDVKPPLKVRIYRPTRPSSDGKSSAPMVADFVDLPWNGKSVDELELLMADQFSVTFPNLAVGPIA